MSTTQQPESLGGKVQGLTGGSRVDLTESEKHQAMSEAMMANFVAALQPFVIREGDVPWLSMRPENWGAEYARSRALGQLGHQESLRQPEGGPPQYRGPAVVDPRDESRANIIKQAYMDMYENAWALGEQAEEERQKEVRGDALRRLISTAVSPIISDAIFRDIELPAVQARPPKEARRIQERKKER